MSAFVGSRILYRSSRSACAAVTGSARPVSAGLAWEQAAVGGGRRGYRLGEARFFTGPVAGHLTRPRVFCFFRRPPSGNLREARSACAGRDRNASAVGEECQCCMRRNCWGERPMTRRVISSAGSAELFHRAGRPAQPRGALSCLDAANICRSVARYDQVSFVAPGRDQAERRGKGARALPAQRGLAGRAQGSAGPADHRHARPQSRPRKRHRSGRAAHQRHRGAAGDRRGRGADRRGAPPAAGAGFAGR